MSHILLVDDAKEVHVLVASVLDDEYSLVSALNIFEAKKILADSSFDLILLDIKLPDGDGFSFCTELKGQNSTKDIPVIFLTGKNQTSDKVIGFSLGAEDYVVKPFDPIELKARIDAKIRKGQKVQKKSNVFRCEDLKFDVLSHRVFLSVEGSDRPLNLTPTGFKLLHYFAKSLDQTFTRDQLISAVWGETFINDRTVDAHIGALRKELEGSLMSILTIHGVGYKMSHFDTKSQKKAV